ncbi:MAG: nucleotidyl transferase AbiEii/AbiGii toxin family protein [Halomonadaceae bacterium]|nr:MAG: nucleotidyl transferase AbiEii/AbiGii toxin family protein [Halomonadaceae bacterium]
MNRNNSWFEQVALLVDLIPLVSEEPCFALKGGTAINLFIRDMPRFSVDIDLVYLPDAGRQKALDDIRSALDRISSRVADTFSGIRITKSYQSKADALRLVVDRAGTTVKIELSPVLRGTVFDVATRSVSSSVEESFGYAEMAVVSHADLYAGKICAALDRQHPRDLFDVMLLLENEGYTAEIHKALLVYLISHPRPLDELLVPNLQSLDTMFAGEFSGMAFREVTQAELEQARQTIIEKMNGALAPDEKRFLLSFQQQQADWKKVALEGVEHLPAIRWKQRNLARMSEEKRVAAVEKLRQVLAL